LNVACTSRARDFLPEAQAADIVIAVIAEFETQGWNLP